MNKLIRELADEAFVTVSSDGYFSSGKFCEKFAELIVAECARVASDRVMDVEGNDWGVRWAIKNHFGVEQ